MTPCGHCCFESKFEARSIQDLEIVASKADLLIKLKRAAAEILLIVIGVSIALAGDSWLAENAENARTGQLLDALETEWVAELKRIDSYLDEVDLATKVIIRTIHASANDAPKMTADEAASLLYESYRWHTFKPSEGALNALMEDGLQNIDDTSLRLAIASWRSTLAELDAEQAALRDLGTITGPKLESKIAQRSGEANSDDVKDYEFGFGMETGHFALVAFADDEWVAHQRLLLHLLSRYQTEVKSVRDTLEQNLSLLRERVRI